MLRKEKQISGKSDPSRVSSSLNFTQYLKVIIPAKQKVLWLELAGCKFA